jgi:hypothetical protein
MRDALYNYDYLGDTFYYFSENLIDKWGRVKPHFGKMYESFNFGAYFESLAENQGNRKQA